MIDIHAFQQPNCRKIMKKVISLLAVFLVAVMWSAPGFSADKYVSGAVGMSWLSDTDAKLDYDEDEGYEVDFDSGITLLGALGCDYGDYRAEGELGYQRGDLESYNVFCPKCTGSEQDISGDVTILSLMMNGYYDISLGGGFELSPAVGVGVAQIKVDNVTTGERNGDSGSLSEVTFAYQAGIGLGIPVSDGIMLDARYRYFGTTDFTFEAGDYQFNAHMKSHNGLLGLRVMF